MSSPQPSTSLAETVPQAIAQDDLLLCQRHIAHHSKSFYLSSLLLPRKVRYDAWALYAFCRQADDAVDGDNPGDGTVPNNAPGASAQLAAVANLRKKLAAVYRGDPGQGTAHAIDRAFSKVVVRTAMPQELPSRLLDGMEQDARGQHYGSWEDLYGYCFNVAATVGLMMTCVMGHKLSPDRLAEVLLRASDLGVAMQLTNIARDVGEDARRGRVYLPDSLLGKHGLRAESVLAEAMQGSPASAGLRAAVAELLATADAHYAAAEVGIAMLPDGVQWAIRSASRIYQRIGRALKAQGFDSLRKRARISALHKLVLLFGAYLLGLLPSARRISALPSTGPADQLLLRLCREVKLLP
ncbi:MAG TPA: phytoene/squalene synthase family protein [Pseudomonadota bacterium]|nr:phytoene/squalene synthase family protein [Pseudomonadota bacterium]HNN54394.1 phytoene/squalene synthase family protein [Pseudomonadota bacterium]